MSTAAPQRPAPASDAAARPAPADSALRRILSGNGTVTVLAILLSLLISGLLIIAVDEDVRDAAGYFFARPGDLLSAAWAAFAGAFAALFRGCLLYTSDAADE